MHQFCITDPNTNFFFLTIAFGPETIAFVAVKNTMKKQHLTFDEEEICKVG